MGQGNYSVYPAIKLIEGDIGNVLIPINRDGYAWAYALEEKDAAFVVKSCNAHHELVDTLVQARAELVDAMCSSSEGYTRKEAEEDMGYIDEALATARRELP